MISQLIGNSTHPLPLGENTWSSLFPWGQGLNTAIREPTATVPDLRPALGEGGVLLPPPFFHHHCSPSPIPTFYLCFFWAAELGFRDREGIDEVGNLVGFVANSS